MTSIIKGNSFAIPVDKRPSDWPQWVAEPAQLEIQGSPQALTLAIDWLATLGDQANWSARTRFVLQLCLEEALTNILNYAADTDFDRQKNSMGIFISAGPAAQGLALLIQDNGLPFDPTARKPDPLADSVDEARIGGHGLRLMQHYASRISYRHEAGWNELWLEFSSL